VAGEVDFGGSSAVVVVLVIFVVLIAAGVGVALFLKSKQKAPIGVAQTALMVPAPAAAVAVVPSAAPVAAAPVAPVASAAPAPAPAPAPVDSLDSLAALAKVTKAELAAWELDDIREMMKDERTCPGGVTVPARKKIEVRRGPVACVVPFGTGMSTRAAVACVLADTQRCACVARRSGSLSGAAGLTLNSCVWS